MVITIITHIPVTINISKYAWTLYVLILGQVGMKLVKVLILYLFNKIYNSQFTMGPESE